MKHTVKVTVFLITLFFIAQGIGLFTVNSYLDVQTLDDGTITIVHGDTIVGQQPEIDDSEKSTTFIMITIMVLIGTALLFVLIKYRLGSIWKLWFLFAIGMTLAISFDVFLTRWVAIALAVILAITRVARPNVIIHNFTEIFVYTGITILILPLLNVISGAILLVIISIYDMIAVWKSKHMITLANFQLESKSFAGFSMSYKTDQKKEAKGAHKKADEKPSNAILGGGDIAFPLLFAAAVMESLILRGVPKLAALNYSFLISLGAGIALSLLFIYSKKDRFYPAMPFVSAGCFAGLAVIWLIV